MPRKSAAALAVLRVDGKPSRLVPREGVTKEVGAIFKEIVAQVSASHFKPTDAALIEQYAQAIALGRRSYAALDDEGPVVSGRANPWIVVLEKAHRSAVALSARLRLSPQHRTDPKTVGRAKHYPSAYDMMEDER